MKAGLTAGCWVVNRKYQDLSQRNTGYTDCGEYTLAATQLQMADAGNGMLHRQNVNLTG